MLSQPSLRSVPVFALLACAAGCQDVERSVAPPRHPPPLSATDGPGTWTTKASMPTARWSLATEVVNGILYAVGGTSGPNPLATVEAFDPATNTWTTKASMPAGRSQSAAAVVNGILYVVGGSSGTLAYDPATNTWTAKASMPAAQVSPAAGVVNGIVYVVGGFSGANWLATVQAYDPATDTWTSKASMPTARSNLAAGVVNGILYAVGGLTSSGGLATVEAYDPATNTWTTKASMPTARFGLAAAVMNGILYAAGGSTGIDRLATVEAYDPATNTWTSEASMPTARTDLGAAAANGILYAVGGADMSYLALARVEAYQPATGGVVFESKWTTALGDTDGAIRDVRAPFGPWTWWQDGGDNLMTVVAGGPSGYANALRVQQRGGTATGWANVQRDVFMPPSTDYYVRYYMRNDDTSSSGDHVVTVETWHYANLTYMRKYSGVSSWTFVISAYSDPNWGSRCHIPEGQLYPFRHWGPWQAFGPASPPELAHGQWYRLEYFVHFTSDTSIQVHPRIYDASGALLYADADFRQEDYSGVAPDDWTLASYYAAGRDFCVDPTYMNDFGMGNNGQSGASDTGQYWYFAGVQIRTDTWPGP